MDNVPVPKSTLTQKLFRIANRDLPGNQITQWLGKKRHSVEQNVPLTLDILVSMASYARERQAKFVLVSAAVSKSNQLALEEISFINQIPYLPLMASEFKPHDEFYFDKDSHWNQSGHRKAADLIECFLAEKGVFKNSIINACKD